MTPKKLKRARKELGLSQFKLSKLSTISRYNISLYETGDRLFTNNETNLILYALNTERKKQNASNKKIKSSQAMSRFNLWA